MEPRRKRTPDRKTRGVEETATARKAVVPALTLPNIAELVAYGEITIRLLRLIGCVATVSEEDNTLTMLVRRRGETLAQLLTRLDQAIAKTHNEDIFTDEINPPPTDSPRR